MRGVLFRAKGKCAVFYSVLSTPGAVFYSVCQNKTPRQVPTHSGIGALLGTEKYVLFVSGKYDFKTDRNINLVLPIRAAFPECVGTWRGASF